jgi:hypothetical protein
MRVDALHRRLVRDVTQIHDVVGEVFPEDKYANKAFNLGSFVKRLNKLTDPFGIHHRIKTDEEVKSGQFMNTAWWYFKTSLPVAGSNHDIHIVWHVPTSGRRVALNKADCARRRFVFWQFIMHELIHRYQDELRKRYQGRSADVLQYAATEEEAADRKMQEYLCSHDEVETYAFMTALEVHTWFPNTSLREALATCYSHTGRKITPTFAFYRVMFDGKHPAYRRFSRKVRVWLDEMKRYPEFYDKLALPQVI